MSLDHQWVDELRLAKVAHAIPTKGEVNVKTDKRDFRFELIDELLDALNYAQWALEKRELDVIEYKMLRTHLLIALDNIPNAETIYRIKSAASK